MNAYKISVSKLLKNLYFGDQQLMVRYIVIEFKEMGFEDGRWMEPNRSGPVNDFQVPGITTSQALGDYYYYHFIIKCVYSLHSCKISWSVG